MKLHIFKKDNSKDIPIKIKSKIIKSQGKRKTRRSKTFNNTKRLTLSKKNVISLKLVKKVRKAIKRFDKHHIEFAMTIVRNDKPSTTSVTRSLKELDPLCVDCNLCVRGLGYCSHYRHNVKITQLRSCEFKELIKQ